jgi:predicted nucleic acid-binding protein
MRYLLDTSVISELVKSKPQRSVLDWAEACDEHSLFLSILTLGELQEGVTKLAQSKRKEFLQSWISNDLIQRFRSRILSVDEEVAVVWGRIQGEAERRGRPMPAVDSLIAATAVAHQMTVVTRNSSDIEESGVSVFNPWNY